MRHETGPPSADLTHCEMQSTGITTTSFFIGFDFTGKDGGGLVISLR